MVPKDKQDRNRLRNEAERCAVRNVRTHNRRREGSVHAPFPRSTFEDALVLGSTMQEIGSGEKVRRSILFERLGKAPNSGPSRMMITNSSKYEITRGTYNSEYLELTDLVRPTGDESRNTSAKEETSDMRSRHNECGSVQAAL